MPCSESHTRQHIIGDELLARQAETEQLARDARSEGQQDAAMTSNARCGLDGCDCEYTIGGLLRRLELIAEQANLTVKQTREPHCQGTGDSSDCPCFLAGERHGYEAERRPLGS